MVNHEMILQGFGKKERSLSRKKQTDTKAMPAAGYAYAFFLTQLLRQY
jgi:hypothetical protein